MSTPLFKRTARPEISSRGIRLTGGSYINVGQPLPRGDDSSNNDENYRYPLPKPEGDIWTNCLDPLLKEDRQRCEAWKDEVQNLLIFAGLFSAVVTAFVIDSYKNLQPDPNETAVVLLSQIVSRLESLSNNTVAIQPQTLPSFSTPASSVRINICWFLSLILSLATVLVGIISMQWLREYQTYSGHLSPKQILAERNMRFESLDKWYIPKILAGLPLLLEIALILFFAGAIDFLFDLNRAVAIPITIAVGATLLFLLFTTMSPVFQYDWLNSNPPNRVSPAAGSVSSPCPYKSQSWAFIALLHLPIINVIWMVNISYLSFWSRLAKFLKDRFSGKGPRISEVFPASIPAPFGKSKDPYATPSNWNHYDLIWLDRRARQATVTHRYFGLELLDTYDAAKGITSIVTQRLHLSNTLAFSMYYCFRELLQGSFDKDILRYISRDPSGCERRLHSLSSPPCSDHEALMYFLNQLPRPSDITTAQNLRKHQMELFVAVYNDILDNSHEQAHDLPDIFFAPSHMDVQLFAHRDPLSEFDDDLKVKLLSIYQNLSNRAGSGGDSEALEIPIDPLMNLMARMTSDLLDNTPDYDGNPGPLLPILISSNQKVARNLSSTRSPTSLSFRLARSYILELQVRTASLESFKEIPDLAFSIQLLLRYLSGFDYAAYPNLVSPLEVQQWDDWLCILGRPREAASIDRLSYTSGIGLIPIPERSQQNEEQPIPGPSKLPVHALPLKLDLSLAFEGDQPDNQPRDNIFVPRM